MRDALMSERLIKDFNDFNTGMMMVRNSPQGQEWLQMILDRSPEYAEDKWKEQQLIIDTYEQYKEIIKRNIYILNLEL